MRTWFTENLIFDCWCLVTANLQGKVLVGIKMLHLKPNDDFKID